MKFITDFLTKENNKEFVVTKEFPNGIKYIYEKYTGYNCLHSFYKPLTDDQIDKLQKDVNMAQKASYIFPEWYRDFFKITNGLNIYFGAISFYGEQTPLVEHPIYGLIEAGIERDNPNWMAPYNLRYSNSIKFNAQARWLTIGGYHCDRTQIVWDYKINKIVAMYALPVTLSIKALRKMKETDYEQLIFAEWDNFETFFNLETKRLSKVFDKQTDLAEVKQDDIIFWKKTLPVGHKDFIG